MNLTKNYSGIAINNNLRGEKKTLSSKVEYEFTLPENFRYGQAHNICPELSGFQLLCEPTELNQQFSWSFYYGKKETLLASGLNAETHAFGPEVWANVFFPEPIPTQIIFEEERTLIYTIIVEKSLNNSIPHYYLGNYRVLALTADSGIDFMGNQYRSLVTQVSL